jgi:hypothetical protein
MSSGPAYSDGCVLGLGSFLVGMWPIESHAGQGIRLASDRACRVVRRGSILKSRLMCPWGQFAAVTNWVGVSVGGVCTVLGELQGQAEVGLPERRVPTRLGVRRLWRAPIQGWR